MLLATRHKRTHPTLTPAGEGWYSIYRPWRDGRLSWPRCLITRGRGIEPKTAGSEVWRPNHCATKTPYVSAPFICHIGLHHYRIWWWQTWFHWTLWPQNLAKDTKVISIVHFLGELWMILCYGGHLGRHLEFHPFCQTEIQTVHPNFFYLPRGVLPGSRVKMRGHLIAHRTPWAPGLDPRVMPSVPEFFKCQIFIIQLCGQLLRYSLGWQQPIVFWRFFTYSCC